MFDIVRRRRYEERRVLIESARILDSPFDDSLICLSGAEQELLRNLTQYLRRQDTFVASYFEQHYLTPDAEAWDTLQAIVAGLEEKLMGCEELEAAILHIAEVAGIESCFDTKSVTASGWELEYLTFDEVPEGYIQEVDILVGVNVSGASTYIRTEVLEGANGRLLSHTVGPAQSIVCGLVSPFRVGEGLTCRVGFFGMDAGDVLRATLVGVLRKAG